jgi:hypothetical protein
MFIINFITSLIELITSIKGYFAQKILTGLALEEAEVTIANARAETARCYVQHKANMAATEARIVADAAAHELAMKELAELAELQRAKSQAFSDYLDNLFGLQTPDEVVHV